MSSTQIDIPLPVDNLAPEGARFRRRTAITVLVVVGLGIVAYFSINRLLAHGPAEDIQLFTVVPRTFPVILEEKGELQAADSIDIWCELEGKSTIIHLIDEGTQVEKGDLLVELASDVIDEQIRDAEIKVATAQAAYEAAAKGLEILRDENGSKVRKAQLALQMAELALKKYQEGERVEFEQDAQLALGKAEYVLRRATEDLADSEDLYKQGFLTRIDLENDRFEKYEAEIALKKAQLAQVVLQKYTVPMDVQQKESDVHEAQKELEREIKAAEASEAKSLADVNAKKSEFDLVKDKLTKLRDQKLKARIVAPAAGMAVYSRKGSWWRSESQIEEGAQVFERQSLIELPDTTSMKVVLRVHEAKTEMLTLGLPANVEIEGFTGRRFTGKVSKIAALADSQNRWLNPNLKEYETEVLLDGEFKELKPGVTARAQILVAELRDALAVPVQAVFGQEGKYYVFRPDGKPAEVKVGMASTEYVEIKEGLASGDEIRLAVTEDMKRQLIGGENGGAKRE